MSKPTALIIDDEPDLCELLSLTLQQMHIDVQVAQSYQEALDKLNTQQFHFCITDMRLPDGSGLDIVRYVEKNQPTLPIMVITAHGSMECAIESLKHGAIDFLNKPIELDELRNIVKTALKLQTSPQQQPAQQAVGIVGQSREIEKLKSTIYKVSRSQAPVFIHGPSGSGKELVARMIHYSSPRSERPFVPINCGAVPKELMESEFFGHAKGSFTGALKDKVGLFQAAHKGTLFLDEVADLPFEMQVKLLRAIQERKIKPVGAHQEISVDVRIVSATHQNLLDLVQANHFREDLYYRLNVIEIKVPPLRARLEDLPALIEHLLARYASDIAAMKPQIDPEAVKKLQQYTFPGNVRELENILERAYAMSEGNRIQAEHIQLPAHPSQAPIKNAALPLEEYLEKVEKDAIIEALESTKWNKTQAAKLLGVSFRSLRYKLNKYQLD